MEVKQVHQTIGVSSQVSDGVVGGFMGIILGFNYKTPFCS